MKTPSEMTNAELADAIEEYGCTGKISDAAVERLRDMPEPNAPEFDYGDVVSMVEFDGALFVARENGVFFHGDEGFIPIPFTGMNGPDCVIPNTPPAPEIWWRNKHPKRKDELHEQLSESEKYMDGNYERIEVRVIK